MPNAQFPLQQALLSAQIVPLFAQQSIRGSRLSAMAARSAIAAT
jgi:hypothetical protein